MLPLQTLLTPKASHTGVSGMWQLVRLSLDPATGEQLNVGVTFTDRESGEITTRMLANVAALRCLYNDDLAEDAAFLIDQAEHAIEQGVDLPVNWNVSLSLPLFVRGSSAKSVVDDLFTRLVPLGAKETTPERLDTDDHLHATRNVRKTVRTLLTRHLNLKSAPDFWRAKPVETVQGGRPVRVDVQIEARDTGIPLHGTIASAWYKTQYHRNAYLDKGATAMMMATELFPRDRNVMYLLCPSQRDGFDAKEINQIESDIASIKWLVEQKKASLAVFESERLMAQRILADVGVI